MRRPPALPLAPFKLPQALAGGLRASFDDAMSSPLPEYLAALLGRLNGGREESSGAQSEDGGKRIQDVGRSGSLRTKRAAR
jgi:hypothetical protein